MNEEELAKELHEAGREAVEKGKTVASDKGVENPRVFLEWDEITENAREGRLIQARYLLDKCSISSNKEEKELENKVGSNLVDFLRAGAGWFARGNRE